MCRTGRFLLATKWVPWDLPLLHSGRLLLPGQRQRINARWAAAAECALRRGLSQVRKRLGGSVFLN